MIEVPEGIGTPGLRGSNLQVPFQNGKRWIKKRYDERIVMLPMWVRGLDSLTGKLPSGKSKNEALYENIDYLSGVFGKRGQFVLKRILPDGTEREAIAKFIDFTLERLRLGTPSSQWNSCFRTLLLRFPNGT